MHRLKKYITKLCTCKIIKKKIHSSPALIFTNILNIVDFILYTALIMLHCFCNHHNLKLFYPKCHKLTLSCGRVAITYCLYPSKSAQGLPVRYLCRKYMRKYLKETALICIISVQEQCHVKTVNEINCRKNVNTQYICIY